ncbi:hypothetical protein KVT40_007941 [Elsinoe batatas]|uniref:F-box domain-containing protein n=1 Tax=Elsinoe batatas TaxID=2601811 RepID=A0A8K0P935_9PEZI|nr:hypothetical protein KVT40_007941 [Elsinoe batatas]
MAATTRGVPCASLRDYIADAVECILASLPQADLLNLCLVNNGSRIDAERHLYSEITCTWTKDRPCLIPSLVNTLLHRPRVADHVRTLTLAHGRDMCYDLCQRVSSRTLDMETVYAFVDASKTDFADEWKEQLLAGRMDAFVALLLARLVALVSLTLEWNYTVHTRLIGQWLQTNSSKYPQLRFVHVRSIPHGLIRGRRLPGSHTPDLLPLFFLPALEKLFVQFGIPPELTYAPATSTCPSLLRSLHVGGLREGQLGTLLLATPNLQHLHWDWEYEQDYKHPLNQPVLDLTAVYATLEPVRQSLRELVIKAQVELQDDVAQPWFEICGSPKQLINFKLDRLEVPLPFLVAFKTTGFAQLEDTIPRDVRTVVINFDMLKHMSFDRQRGNHRQIDLNEWDDDSLLDLIEVWTRSWPQWYPYLSHVTIPSDYLEFDPNHKETLQWIGRLKNVFSQHAVGLKVDSGSSNEPPSLCAVVRGVLCVWTG